MSNVLLNVSKKENLKTKNKLGVKLFLKFLNKYYKKRKVREFYYDKYNWTLMKKKSILKRVIEINKIRKEKPLELLKWKNILKKKKIKYYLYNYLLQKKEKKNNKFFEKYLFSKLKIKLNKWVFNSKLWTYNKFEQYNKYIKIWYSYWKKKGNKRELITKMTLAYLYLTNFYFYYFKYFSSKRSIINFIEQKKLKSKFFL